MKTSLNILNHAIGALLLISTATLRADEPAQPTDEDGRLLLESRLIYSAFYPLDATFYRGKVYRWQYGGGISTFGDDYLLATREGLIYTFNWDDHEDLEIERLSYEVPFNAEKFNDAVGDEVNAMWFRVADVFVQERANDIRVYATHHFWNEAERCVVMRVSVLAGTYEQIVAEKPDLQWATLYETSPCIPIANDNKGNPFAGNLVGGRISLFDEDTLLVTIGDHGLDGVENTPAMPQDRETSYGKTMLIDATSGDANIFTLGNRTPNGLYVDKRSGVVWETENGPQGGDELNLLVEGGNYGWPEVTYGMAYGMNYWPGTEHPDEHFGYLQPTFAWVPSIGVSNLIVVEEGSVFPRWEGDLLVSSMRDQSLWRIRVRDERVAYAERIELKTRIRDLLQGHDGRIVIWSDEGELISLSEYRADVESAE